MSTARRFLKNFLSLSVAEVLNKIIAFITVAYLARVLGATAFGKINFVEAILCYFLIITDLGLGWIGIREIARDKENKERVINTTFILKSILFFIAFAFLLILILFIPKPQEIKTLLLLYGLTLLPASLLIDWIFNGLEKMEYAAAMNVIAKVIFMSLVLLSIKSASQIFMIPVIKFITDTLLVIALIIIFNKLFGKIRPLFDKTLAIEMLKKSLPLGLSLYMIRIYYNFDTILLGFMKDNQTVGYYNAAYKIILVLIAFSAAFYNALFPIISNYYRSSIQDLTNFQRGITKILVTVALPLGLGTTLLADKIIPLIYGATYNQAIIALQILIWAVVIIFIDIPFANSLVAVDRQNKFSIFVTIGAVVNLILNFILIPSFGIVGAAVTTIAAEIIVFLLSYNEISKVIRNSPFPYMIKPSIASLIMGISILLLNNYVHTVGVIIIATIAYFLSLYIVRGVTAKDIQFAREMITRRMR